MKKRTQAEIDKDIEEGIIPKEEVLNGSEDEAVDDEVFYDKD